MRDNPFKRRLEAVADIAFVAGAYRYHSGDSRKDVEDFIAWADEFESTRTCPPDGNETYNGKDYMTAVAEFAEIKLKEEGVGKAGHAKANALSTFLSVWGDDQYLVTDIGPKLGCGECDALFNLLKAYGFTDTAEALLDSHSLEDDDDDYPEHVTRRDKMKQEEPREDVPF
jgi:hypothetical protein